MANSIIGIHLLQDYYFSGNIPDIRILTADPIEVSIQLISSNPFTIIELHEPELNESVVISISDLIHEHLYAKYDSEFVSLLGFDFQAEAFGQVIITPEGQSPVSFYVVKGRLDAPASYDFKGFLEENLLNTCPQTKLVTDNQPNIFNYYLLGNSKIVLQAKILTGYDINGDAQYSTQSEDLLSVSGSNALISFDANLALLESKFTIDPAHTIEHIDVWGVNNTSGKTTHKIRIAHEERVFQNMDVFAFENSLGGIDIIQFTGVFSENITHDYLSFVNRSTRKEYKTIPNVQYEKNTGFLIDKDHILFVGDFLASANKYHLVNNVAKRIFTTGMKADTTKETLNSYAFGFSYADHKTSIMLNREDL